uniref:Uncharacterized protein n=1 Tax=Alexandrium monilatum TaxID=311494 RepID=A0A7S4S472_9DINO
MAAGRDLAKIARVFSACGKATIAWSELADILRYTDGSFFTDANIARLFDGFECHRGSSVRVADFLQWLAPSSPVAEPLDRGMERRRRHLVLNFDINKTIVMMDSATGKTMEDIANHVLALSAWGSVAAGVVAGAAPAWQCEVGRPSVERPRPGLVSYAEFLEAQFPGQGSKECREQLWHRFTHPGEPGEALRPHCDDFLAALKLPRDVAGSEAARVAGLHGEEVFIIPAFFELLLHLQRSGLSFSLVFRTFGTDLREVAEEFNAFCEGRHPLYPGAAFDGRDGGPDYRIAFNDPSAFGTFFRSSLCGKGDALVYGTLRQPKLGEAGLEMYADHAEFPYVRVVSGGIGAVFQDLRRRSRKPGTLALRDYFPFWRAQGMGSDAGRLNGGKLMVIDPRPSSSVHEVFFDDNILYTTPRIVDARLALFPGKVLSMRYLSPCHLVRAEPLEAVTDRGYFARHVERLSAAYERRLAVFSRVGDLCKEALRAKWFPRGLPRLVPGAAGYDPWAGFLQDERKHSKATSFAEPQELEEGRQQ